jgi:cytochrome c biogenesis protein
MQKNNSIWQFFASVKLALVILFLIAVTSIIGTIIPQKESAEFYINNFGPQMAQLFAVLDIVDMYNSWWFIGLLFLLAFNLIICSFDRFPGVWKQVTADGLSMPVERLQKMANRRSWQVSTDSSRTAIELKQQLAKKGFKTASSDAEGQTLLFSHKGHWTRTGVYLVHASILIIFIGAIIGSLGGFKGSVVIPETMERNKIFLYDNKGTAELDFAIRCNKFAIDFYPNGMPKEYTSSLTVLENGQEVLTKTIEVNDPLTYKGITFYQSSYEAYQDFVIVITNTSTGQSQRFISGFQKQTEWPEENITFGVINTKAIGQSIVTSKLWFSDNKQEPSTHWIEAGETATIESGAATYEVALKQMYATGLQVAKDPGVWWVYLGCGLMLFGLYVAFFMSHKRIWVLVTPTRKGSEVLLCGSANKNRAGFENSFEELATLLQNGTSEKKDERPAL